MTIESIGRSVSDLSNYARDRHEHNVNLAIAHHTKTGAHVVPLRIEQFGISWRGSALEHFEGAQSIRRQFERNLHQQTAPGVHGQGILIGAYLPDGSVYTGEGVPPAKPQAAAPIVSPLPPEPAAAPPAAKLSPKKIAAAIAKAKAAIGRGADRAAVLSRLRSAGIETSEI